MSNCLKPLLPCPICGGRADRLNIVGLLYERYQIRCSFCGLSTECRKSVDEVDHLWNYRPVQNRADRDRDALESLVFMALSENEPIITISRGRELLGFETMEEMRHFLEKRSAKGDCDNG